MSQIALLQERVEQHRAQRGAKRERESRLHAIAQPAFHDLDERQVALRDRLKEPVFLKKFFVFRVPDKWQVRVEDECEVAGHIFYRCPDVFGGQ